MELVSSLGADVVIDYTATDFTRVNEQFDFVFDSVGKSTFGKCRRILKPRGIYISTELGPYWQNPWLALFTFWMPARRCLFPLPVINAEIVEFIRSLAEKGEYRPVIDKVYSMAEIPDAFRYVLTGMKTGNVVIRISEAEGLADEHYRGAHSG
jgi:NADPH:quinone reductase-like Zn-dependent oxidoreductase